MAKNNQAPSPAVEPGAVSRTYTKDQLLASKRYAARRDMLAALLDGGRSYTLAEADRQIAAFEKGTVI